MNTIAARAVPAAEEISETPGSDASSSTAQVGAPFFSDLVRAHFRREQSRTDVNAAPAPDMEADYHCRLEEFERQEGKLAAVYWSTKTASAVALTIGKPRAARNPIAETEMEIKIHRVTDWLMKDTTPIANVLHECDLLAIRAGEILRGTSERIAMRWIYSVQEHILGYLERESDVTPEKERAFVAQQRHELGRIEEYYLRSAAKAGRIVYVSGMLAGAFTIVGATALAAFLLDKTSHWNRPMQVLLISLAAGALGALVSVLVRMNSGADNKFSVDFEVGRPLLRRLGLYKPLVGSVFGAALYFMLASGLFLTKEPQGNRLYFYGALAFVAGFAERRTAVIFGDVERLISPGADHPDAQPPPEVEAAAADGAA